VVLLEVIYKGPLFIVCLRGGCSRRFCVSLIWQPSPHSHIFLTSLLI